MPEHHHHHRFPEKWAFVLNNPIRKWLNPPEKLIAKLGVGSKDTVMDFGCGPGFITVPLAKAAGKVIAVDVSTAMLERTSHYAQKQRVSVGLVQSDGSKLDVETGSVDLILLNHVFHEIEDKRATLREFVRILKPSGKVAIIERTRGSRVFRSLGPPIIEPEEVEKELTESGFSSLDVSAYGGDSIVTARRPNS